MRHRLRAVEIHSFVPGAGHTRISLAGMFIATASRAALAFLGEAKAIRAAMQQDEDLHRLSSYSLALDLLLDAARTWRAFQDERNVVLAGQVPYSAIMSLSSARTVPERLTISFSESLTNPGWPREFFLSVLLAEGEETAATVTGRLALAIVHQRLEEEGTMPTDRRALEEVAVAAEHDGSASRYEFPVHVPISDAGIHPS